MGSKSNFGSENQSVKARLPFNDNFEHKIAENQDLEKVEQFIGEKQAYLEQVGNPW
jgi:hypothetical protein